MSTHVSNRPSTSSPSTVIVQQAPGGPLVLQPRRRRDAVAARLLAPWLDARLARGVAPESSRLLAARAGQLVDPTARRSTADGWDRVLTRASRPRGLVDSRVPLAVGDVSDAVDAITELTAVLRGRSPMAARDVARARALLTDGTGPLYQSGRGLRQVVVALVASSSGHAQ